MRRVKMKSGHLHTNSDGTQIHFAGAGCIYPVTDEMGETLVNLGVAIWLPEVKAKPLTVKKEKKEPKPAPSKAIGKNKQLKVEE